MADETLESQPRRAQPVGWQQMHRAVLIFSPNTTTTQQRTCYTQASSHDLMSSSQHDTWPALIAELQQKLQSYEQPSIASADEHREQLMQLCQIHKERDPQRLLNRIRKEHSRIFDLTSAIESADPAHAQEAIPALSLTALVWSVSKKAVQVALEARTRLVDLIDEIKKLNAIVPNLNREHPRKYHSDKAVQKPLQLLFREYMATYCAIFSQTVPITLCLGTFDTALEGKDVAFKARKAEWEQAFERAREEEQQRIINGTVSSNASEPMVWQRTNANFEHVRKLGSGKFGQVCEVRQITTGKLFAQKFIAAPPKETAARALVKKQVLSEVAVMEKLRHHHIASMLFYTEETSGFSLVMLPVADSNLREYLDGTAEEGFSRERVKILDPWFGCLMSALAFAHSNLVKHEDIKLSNILIKDRRVYLADFGCAKDFEHAQSSISGEESLTGTPAYWPPEKESRRGRAADLFALGCVFSEMFTVRQGKSLTEYGEARKAEGKRCWYAFGENLTAVKTWLGRLDDIDKEIPSLLLEVIEIMLEEDPENRTDARRLRKRLRGDEESLFCGSCV